MNASPLFLTSDALSAIPGLSHGFFTRQGGVSRIPLYASLNCGPGSRDDVVLVAQNRRRVAAALDAESTPLVTCYQVHGAEVVTVHEPWKQENAPLADGLVTDVPGIILGTLTADCVPVLFADAQARVIGAAHAGWKGVHKGILSATVEAMLTIGAKRERIVAAIGPAIAQSSYEVGDDLRDALLAESGENARFFRANDVGRWQFALTSYAAEKLAGAGVERINLLAHDTFSDEDAFFSYRRTTKRDEADYGRQVSAIMIRK